MLPYKPESLESLRSRYAVAVENVFDPDTLETNPEGRPGLRRECVFDCEDGLRLIISKDLIDVPRIHLSASAQENTELWKKIKNARIGKLEFSMLAKTRFREISLYSGYLGFAGWSPGAGVPHWYSGSPDINRIAKAIKF